MQKLFYPESVAIVGLSAKPTNIARYTLDNMLRWGYRGRIYGVNPRGTDLNVDGIKMYQHMEDIPEVPDLAFLMIPAKYVPETVEQCGQFGVKWMAISSGGFAEFSEEGKTLAEETLASARRHGVRIVGPNSVAVANNANGLCLPFVPVLRVPMGEMSIISQSGGLSIGMLHYLKDENIGLAKLASIGNKLDLDEVDFLEYFGQDPQTGIICIYLESMDRGREFIEAAKRIDKPIVVYKSNTTSAGKKAAMSHTAAVSSDEDIIDSALEEAGVIRVNNLASFINLIKVFRLPPMKGRRIMVMSPAGGFSVIGADLCEKAGFQFANMGPEFYDNLKQRSNAGIIQLSNPLDLGDVYDPRFVADVIYSVLQSDRVDGAILISERPQMPPGDSIFHRMFLTDIFYETWGSILSSGKPLAVCLSGQIEMTLQAKQIANYPIFNSPEEAVGSLAIQMKHYEKKRKLSELKDAVEPAGIDRQAARQWMQEKRGDYGEEILDLLAAYGIGVAASRVAAGKDEAVKYARELGFPVVMKVVSPDALHKSDAGGVIVGVEEAGQVEKNFGIIRDNLGRYKKDASFQGVRIQQMAPEGHDLFVGGKHDPSFGSVVFFGMGGIYIELFRDVANTLCPAGADSIYSRLQSLKSFALLNGLRGQAPGDVPSFVDLVVRVSLLLADFPGIRELDINPVRVFRPGAGAMALDARARIE